MDALRVMTRAQTAGWVLHLILVAFVFSLYMPGVARDILYLAALGVVYSERHLLQVDVGIKRIAYMMLGYIFLFTVLSTDYGRSAKGAYDMLRGLLVFYVGYLLGLKLEDEHKFAALTVGALILLLGNFAFPNDEFVFPFYGYFENPNNSAVAITIFTILSVPLFPKYPGYKVYWALGGLGFLVGVYLLLLTNSRGAWLGLFGALVVLIYLVPHIKRSSRIAVSVILVCGLTGIVFLANSKGLSLSLRDKIWIGLLTDTWENRPWLGYGINRIKDVLHSLDLPTQTAHNIFLEIFVASGVVGLVYILTLVLSVFKYFSAFSYRNNTVLYMGVMGLAAYFSMAQFDLKMSSFTFMASISLFLGFIYSQRLAPA